MGISLTTQPKKALHLAKLNHRIKPGLEKAMRDIGVIVSQRARRNVAGPLLQIRTGRLYRGIDYEVVPMSMGFALSIGVDLTDVPYARIQALGGWTGRGHKTRIKATRWLRKSLTQEKTKVRSRMNRFVARIVRN